MQEGTKSGVVTAGCPYWEEHVSVPWFLRVQLALAWCLFPRKSTSTLCQYLSLGIHLLYSALRYCSKALPLNRTIMVTRGGEC